MRPVFAKVSVILVCLAAAGACSTKDAAEMAQTWPDLSDIAPVPDRSTSAEEPENIIQALRDEAERRKGEGYQDP